MLITDDLEFSIGQETEILLPIFTRFIEHFDFGTMRKKNFLKAKYFALATNSKSQLVAIVFINRKFIFLNNTTWLVLPANRKFGIASELISLIKSKYIFLVAYTRNQPSSNLARKMGFFVIANRFCFWFKFLT